MRAGMAYEQALFERKSAGSAFLQKVAGQSSAPHDACDADANGGAASEGGAEILKMDSSEMRARLLLTNRCVAKCDAGVFCSGL